jgi:pyrimidine-nucleoside phosphorylase
MVSACGLSVPMLSGRGLGHTGGTLDKMESIPAPENSASKWLSTALSMDDFKKQIEKEGLAISAQTPELCPADGKIYALRDVTGTVESIPLITASIMSKKIAEGTKSLVLDVKVGSGAFMKSEEKAKELARSLIGVGEVSGVKTCAQLTDMSEPLGRFVGNALEVKESIEYLRGENIESRLDKVIMTLCARMLVISGKTATIKDAEQELIVSLRTGKALEKFTRMIELQGGNPKVTEDLSILPEAKYQTPVRATKSGFICEIDTERVGMAGVVLGAGRMVKDSIIDPSSGFEILRKRGEPVTEGEAFIMIHHNKPDVSDIVENIKEAYKIEEVAKEPLPVIYGLIDIYGEIKE